MPAFVMSVVQTASLRRTLRYVLPSFVGRTNKKERRALAEGGGTKARRGKNDGFRRRGGSPEPIGELTAATEALLQPSIAADFTLKQEACRDLPSRNQVHANAQVAAIFQLWK